eukprot:TRINITY_DN4919_c0_g1_i1.p1 TRINITY_DN4919_c0_g1~~TRINITY_DN4919_c0_g1_i1.p1  ORF type:complete len:301 (+),score=66.18 TRINITY_DN4919_c0_g1_i1:64-966(+)
MLSWMKSQASEVTSVIGRDLAEFAEVVSQDTKHIIETIDADDAGCEVGDVERLANDIKTYTDEVDTASPVFKRWLETSQWTYAGAADAIAQVIASNTSVSTYHTELVPDTVSDEEFWQRYFFRLHVVQQEASRRRLLETIEQEEKRQTNLADSGDWDTCLDPDADPQLLMRMLKESRAECSTLRKKVSELEAEVRALKSGDSSTPTKPHVQRVDPLAGDTPAAPNSQTASEDGQQQAGVDSATCPTGGDAAPVEAETSAPSPDTSRDEARPQEGQAEKPAAGESHTQSGPAKDWEDLANW